MKKIIKFAIAALGISAIVAEVFRRQHKLTVRDFEKVEKDFENLGYNNNDDDRLKELFDENIEYVKRLHDLCAMSTSFDVDIVNCQDLIINDLCLDNTIRVIQNKNRKGDDTVHFLIQVPPYIRGNGSVLPSVYLNQLKAEFENREFFQFIKYKGYYSFKSKEPTLDSEGKPDGIPEIFKEIPPEMCEKYTEDGKPDGLARMVSYFANNNGEKLNEKNLESVSMFVDIAFKLESPTEDGLTILDGSKILKDLLALQIGPKKTQLKGIIYHPNNDLGFFYNCSDSISQIQWEIEK